MIFFASVIALMVGLIALLAPDNSFESLGIPEIRTENRTNHAAQKFFDEHYRRRGFK